MGAATARRFAAEGARLVLVGLRADALRSVAEELGAIAVPGDAADSQLLAAAVATPPPRSGGSTS